ncbi:hypothetical protein GGQ68_002534 [Sagittula marina]|uniref:DUF3307 domain-containing protein n=1 Tax=Sagittula marina TaxID=943940 RepID=A0A7W6DN47_9RHOB|nr:DUF3307 domain-containing protein [Sagittula marina]MBB3986196.1 hypothetical protein [Sagittula marina]
MFETLALLIFAHALADYPVQATWIATTKSHRAPHPSGYPWYQSLAAHSVIHGGFVGIITGSLWLGIAETALHFLIDYLKSDGAFGTGPRSVNIDQALHISCKLIWVAILAIQ